MKQAIKESFAMLLAHIIKIDNRVTQKEVKLFCSLMKQDFGCNQEEAFEFLKNAVIEENNIDNYIDIINNALKDENFNKMHILEQLNHMIYTDSISSEEYAVFEKIKKILFPNSN